MSYEKRETTMFGYAGTLERRAGAQGDGRWRIQRFVSKPIPIDLGAVGEPPERGRSAFIVIRARFDDEHDNGHNEFSITAETFSVKNGVRRDGGFGCLHEDIAAYAPQFKDLIPFHLCSSDGPMGYPGNTIYLAGDRDHNGLRKGEPWAFDEAIRFKGGLSKVYPEAFVVWVSEQLEYRREEGSENPEPFKVCEVEPPKRYSDSGSEYSLEGFDFPWGQCPFKTPRDAEEFASLLNEEVSLIAEHGPDAESIIDFESIPSLYSKGKERELASARSAAIWPDATDEELMAPKEELMKKLEARLPGVLAEFRKVLEEAGFEWTAPAPKQDVEQSPGLNAPSL